MLSQALIQYCIIVTDYGFNLSATRKIAIAENQNEIDSIYSNTLSAKLILATISFAVLILLVYTIPSYDAIRTITIIMFFSVIGNCLFPLYLFQGTEKMANITWITIVAKFLMLIAMFLLVKSKDDLYWAAFCISIPMFISGLLSLAYISSKRIASFKGINLNQGVAELKHSSTLFISQIAISFYTTFNTILLGHYYSPSIVGYYSAADKLRAAAQSCLSPVQQVVFPRVNKEQSQGSSGILKYGTLFILLSAVISFAIFIAGEYMVYWYLGSEYKETAIIFKYMSVLILVVSVAIVYGQWGLITLGKQKLLTKIYIIGAVMHCSYSIYMAKAYGLYGMLASVILTETLITCAIVICYINTKSKSR